MSKLRELHPNMFQGHVISNEDVAAIGKYILEDGRLDMQDVKFLIETLISAKDVCPAFDELLFPVLKDVLLADGVVGIDEQFYLLKMLYGDGRVRENEKEFLRQLRAEAKEVTPEFEQLCATALASPETDWDVGGK